MIMDLRVNSTVPSNIIPYVAVVIHIDTSVEIINTETVITKAIKRTFVENIMVYSIIHFFQWNVIIII